MADTAQLEHRGSRAVQRMVEFAPASGGLALWARHADRPAGEAAPPICTDGATLFYGEGFAELPLELQTGLVAHEVLHVALRHAQRLGELRRTSGDVDPQLFNICADAIVNSALAHLRWLRLPPGSVLLAPLLKEALGLALGEEQALLQWDVERLYRAIDDRRPEQGGKRSDPQRGGGGDGQRGGGQRSERRDGPRAARARALGAQSAPDLLPGADADGAPESEEELARQWGERLLRGHAGDGAHSMLRALLADLPRSRTPWEQVLRTLLRRALLPVPSESWSRPARSYLANQGRVGDRRMPFEPGRSGSRAVPRLCVIVDVSGSIDEALLARFAREVQAIARRLSAALVLIVGDDQVRRVERFAPGRADLGELKLRGGGGTDFTPLLEEADRHGPDIAVVLTDLEGPARFRPRWPVIWAVPEEAARMTEPFGRKLVLRA